MKTFFNPLQRHKWSKLIAFVFLLPLTIGSLNSQCTPVSGTLSGKVFIDYNNDGELSKDDDGHEGVTVFVYDENNNLRASVPTSSDGAYNIDGLNDDQLYRVQFQYTTEFSSSKIGADNNSSVQFVEAPACNVSFGILPNTTGCGSNPDMIATCFVQGDKTNQDIETIIGFEHNFNLGSNVTKYASHGETGSIWGIGWKSSSSQIFSSAFVKQYSGLKAGPGAIFVTKVNPNGNSTELYADLSSKVDVGTLNIIDVADCDYGAQVGKFGLGNMVLSNDEQYLYVTNLYSNSIVKLSTNNPDDVTEYAVPNPGCSNGEYNVFALKNYNGKLYVGVTCTAQTSRSDADSKAIVYEWDESNPTDFINIFETAYLKGFWYDTPADRVNTAHWFTDIEFSDDNHMIIGFTDRVGHRYCNEITNRLDTQSPDILMVYKNKNGDWTLESNGATETLTSSAGVGNGQGPGGGEFFSFDHWPRSESLHPETALGSFFIYPGSGEIVAMVYDPDQNAYSGGIHRYDTNTGALNGAKELYVRNPSTLFGKATGFGDVTSKCVNNNIQIGNFVWFDDNGNGVQDANEDPISGLTINLLDENCGVIATTQTNDDGVYLFEDVKGGVNYYIALPEDVLDEVGLVNVGNESYIFTDYNTPDDILDSDASVLDIDCDNVIIPVQVGFTNHSFDIGLKEASGFDLALKKIVLDNSIAHLNETIPFRITVYNQGGIPAKNIKVVDYIPEGYEFVANDNIGWSFDNDKAYYTFKETLFPGESDQVTINLKLISTDLNKIVNVSEIASATDHKGNVVEDDDSIMDEISDNDNGGQVGSANDDEILDDGTFDEDDSDPAVPNIFDLALSQYYEEAECVTGGSEIVVKISVFNQGNVPSKSFHVTNYGSPLLNFNEGKNPDWDIIDGVFVYEGEKIIPGTKVTLDLIFDVINSSQDIEVVNYAEISNSIPEGRNVSEDSDSTPDSKENNDKGGTPNTDEDNYVLGSPDVEEDDHDPILIHPRIVDLALKLTTESGVVTQGQEVCFDITIYNQGFMPISEISIVDYVPNGLNMLPNQGWEITSNDDYKKVVIFANNLAPNTEYVEQICLEVGDLTGIYSIENFAEISSITGVCGEDLSLKDRDSKADDLDDNDIGGVPFTSTDDSVDMFPSEDEDDHDVALLINVESTITNACQYKCPATEPGNGVILSTIVLDAPTGMTWRIDQGIGYFDESSTAGNLVPLNIGEELTVSPGANPSESKYTFTGAFASGKPYTARFKSDNNDFVYVESGGVCSYKTFPVTGPIALCTSGIATYSVTDNSSDSYGVSISGGGIILNETNNGKTITVDWNGTTGDHEIRFENTVDCTVEPIILDVVTGSTDNAMKCKTSSNLSVDADCEVEITPLHVIAGNPIPDAAYAVMLTLNDEAIPGNIVNASHIGKTVMAKLIEGCGGNSCWGSILIEDKMAPFVTCEDVVTVSCYKAAQYRGPVAIDNCGNPVTLHLLDSTYTKVQCDDITGFFLKSYQAEDQSGNLSKVCQQRIDVLRVELDSIKFPENMTMLTALSCNDYLKDANGNPDPSLTGVPTLEGDPVFPNFDNFCNIVATYKDEGPYPFGCADKIIRTWTIWDESCIPNPRSISKEQTIVIGDKTPPTITCPDPSTASTSFSDCEAKFTVEPATNLTDDCAVNIQVDVTYPGGFKANKNGGFDIYLSAGTHTITYTAIDGCDRNTSCTTTVSVADKSAPLAVCDKNTTVALTSQGEAYIYAQTFDDGSYDACGIVEMMVRREDFGAACGENVTTYQPTVSFCCADVNTTVPVKVAMQVTDLAGNTNTCWVNVFVQDKTKPTIECPKNEIISCLDHYDLDELAMFDNTEFGTAKVEDACGVDTMYVHVVENVSSCRVGYINRTFFASDGSTTVSCTQRISIEKEGIFDFDDIIMPRDTFIENACVSGGTDPEDLDLPHRYPIIDDGICDLVSFAHKDKMYQFNNDTLGTCFKIIRRWTVINHCDTIDATDPNNIKVREIEFDQVIKVSKTQGPTFTSDLSDKSAFLNANSCDEGFIILEASAEGCLVDEELDWSYQVFLNGSNTPEPRVNGGGSMADASGNYPLGSHIIQWSFSDMCGNTTTKSQNFKIVDNKKPIPVCLDSVSVALVAMDLDNNDTLDTEMACIWPDNLNRSSSHPCFPPESLEYSFNEFNTLDSLCFDCFDLGPNMVNLYVIDPEGNFDFCTVTVIIQDTNNDDLCPTLEDCITWPADLELDCDETLVDIDTSMSKPTIDPTCACTEFNLSFVDVPVTPYAEPVCATFTRTWTLTFTCGQDQAFEYSQTITKFNQNLPVYSCPKDVTVGVDMGSCDAMVVLDEVMISDSTCNTGVTVTNSINGNGANASGVYSMAGSPHEVVFTIADDCNSETCSTFITVTDSIAPIIGNCLPLEISLDPNGKYTLALEDFINIAPNAMDNCVDQNALAYFTNDRDTFNCEDVGEMITITIFVEAGGLLDSCTANITIEDNLPPMANCTDITRVLNALGEYELSDADLAILGGSSTDNCSIEIDVDKDGFQCQDDLGQNSVLVTVSDNNGQEDTCTAIVTILDTLPPTAMCTDISVNLFATGEYSLTNSNINEIAFGSTDNCGFTVSVSPNQFDCSNVGSPNAVLLTVSETPPGSLQDTCTAFVTVNDLIPPTAVCDDISVMLNAMGMYMFDQDDLDEITMPGSSDNCSYVASNTDMFDCDDVGELTTAVIVITDPQGLTDECTINVTVTEAAAPVLVCNNITVYLDDMGNYALNIMDSLDIISGSMGTCDISIDFEPTDFDCTTIGNNNVTVTLTDANNMEQTCTAIVEVLDTIAPIVVCNDITVDLDANGMYTLTALDENNISNGSTDACGFASINVQPADFNCTNVGDNIVLLTVVDVNGNMDTCSATVNVMDVTPPTASCNDITINVMTGGVTLSIADSLALINGSMDACGFTASISPNTFTCADTSAAVTVTVTLTDPSNNISMCTAEVTVESTDTLMCITNDITVYLTETGCVTLDIDDIDGGSGAGCETMIMREIDIDSVCCNDAGLTAMNMPTEVTLTIFVPGVDTATCVSNVQVFDTLSPMITCLDTMINCDIFDGDFEALDQYVINDNCMNIGIVVDTLSTTMAINDCSQGFFLREVMVTDVGGNTDVCTVNIMITGPASPVTLMDFDLPMDTVTVDNCMAYDTSITGAVAIDNDTLTCEFFEITFSDDPMTPPGMCSDTIIRTWELMDTCNNNTIMFEQVILIVDTIAPVLSVSTDTVFVANPNQDCELFVGLDTVVTVTDCANGTITITNNSLFADDNNSSDASGTYPGGTYDITVIATDECGNSDTISYVVEVEASEYVFNCDKVIQPIDSITLMACVAVTDVAQVTGICDTTFSVMIRDDLTGIFYDEPDTVKLGCDRIGDNVFTVYLFQDGVIIDSCTVRSDAGRTLITITDPDGDCPTSIGKVSGKILTYNTLPVEAVKMDLIGAGLEYEMTNADGEYTFPEMAAGGEYMVKPYKNDDVLNGVSTLDLILMQRHILNIAPLGSTYDVIAADVNNDNKLTVSDLVDLRRVLLGLKDNFKNNTSWKMIDARYEFPVYMDPFAENYPLEYEISPLQGSKIVDFVGVKIGDVNGSYEPNVRGDVSDNRSSVNMVIRDREIQSNEETDLRISFNGIDQAYGLQTSLEIDGLSKIIGIGTSETGVALDYNIVGQTIKISAYSDKIIDLNDFEILISFEANESKSLSEIVSINNSLLASEIYTQDLDTRSVDLLWTNNTAASSVISIEQNKPNPWNDKTFVEVKLSEDKDFTFSVVDLTGKMIHQRVVSGKKGTNKVELTDSDVDYATGVFIVIFDADGIVVKQRMIRIN